MSHALFRIKKINYVVCNNVKAPLTSIMYSVWRTLTACYLSGSLPLNHLKWRKTRKLVSWYLITNYLWTKFIAQQSFMEQICSQQKESKYCEYWTECKWLATWNWLTKYYNVKINLNIKTHMDDEIYEPN